MRSVVISRCRTVPFETGYGLPMGPTQVFDDDYGNTKAGVPPSGPGQLGNYWPDGGQNICNLGQLMWARYIEESAESVGCPQADFTEVTPFT